MKLKQIKTTRFHFSLISTTIYKENQSSVTGRLLFSTVMSCSCFWEKTSPIEFPANLQDQRKLSKAIFLHILGRQEPILTTFVAYYVTELLNHTMSWNYSTILCHGTTQPYYVTELLNHTMSRNYSTILCHGTTQPYYVTELLNHTMSRNYSTILCHGTTQP